MTKKTIKQQCDSCKGTGLYRGFAEAKNEAVICLGCDGKGWRNHTYTEFVGRRKMPSVKTICLSRGTFIGTGVGGYGKNISYDEFEKKYPVKF